MKQIYFSLLLFFFISLNVFPQSGYDSIIIKGYNKYEYNGEIIKAIIIYNSGIKDSSQINFFIDLGLTENGIGITLWL